jgi:ribosomal subunit interface protein
MQIHTNSDSAIAHHELLAKHVETVITAGLQRFQEHLSGVEVHLSASHDSKSSSDDHRCLIEARMDGHSTIVASDHAASFHTAIQGATEKLKRSIDSTLGRINANGRSDSIKFATEAIPDEVTQKNSEA